jgi:predicted phosphodiesterase
VPKNTIIVSDLHLTPEFNQKKFDYLQSLFQKADRLIVNGDLWSYYYCDFADFLDSKWRNLFPVMLEKKCIYIHGNHDRKEWCDENSRLFSIENHDKYSIKQLDTTFNIQHGHLISKMSIKNKTLIKYIKEHKLDKYNCAVHKMIITKWGDKFYSRLGMVLNKKHKKFVKKFIPSGEFLICGHSHSPEGSSNRRYINTGFINYGYSSYLQLNKEISLVKETY